MDTPRTPMRHIGRAVLGLTLAAGLCGAAAAADYVVLKSSDPAIARGTPLNAGVRIALSAGGTLTVMHASGDIVIVRGGADGVVLPARKLMPADAERMEVLRAMVAPAAARPAPGFGRTRAGVCPLAARLATLDQIVAAERGGCVREAAQALETYIVAHSE